MKPTKRPELVGPALVGGVELNDDLGPIFAMGKSAPRFESMYDGGEQVTWSEIAASGIRGALDAIRSNETVNRLVNAASNHPVRAAASFGAVATSAGAAARLYRETRD